MNLKLTFKIKNFKDMYKGINDFKKGYQPRTDTVKDEKGDLFTNSHSILANRRNHFSGLLNVHVVNDIRQTKILTAERLVSECSVFEFEMATEKLKDTNHQILIKFQQN